MFPVCKSKDKNAMAAVARNSVSREKKNGGLGLEHMRSFHNALMTNQLGKFVENPNTLCPRVIKHKYKLANNTWEVRQKAGTSYV